MITVRATCSAGYVHWEHNLHVSESADGIHLVWMGDCCKEQSVCGKNTFYFRIVYCDCDVCWYYFIKIKTNRCLIWNSVFFSLTLYVHCIYFLWPYYSTEKRWTRKRTKITEKIYLEENKLLSLSRLYLNTKFETQQQQKGSRNKKINSLVFGFQ